MRFSFALLAVVSALPLSAQQPDPLAFLRKGATETELSFNAYRDQPYAPIRIGELRAAGFLTELRDLPFGDMLGPVDPAVVRATQSAEAAMPGTLIAVRPPAGASYQPGDTVLLALVVPGPREWGNIVIPTGLARIGDHTPSQTLATVLVMYGPIRRGQVVLPLEPVPDPGKVQPAPIAGPSGEVIISEEPRELQQVGGMMFINIGRSAGIRVGDVMQLRRRPGSQTNAPDTIDDPLAVGEVVHVGEKSSTIRLTRIIDPDIHPGTPVVRIATLPS